MASCTGWMPIKESFRDTKATHYGLDLADESRIQTQRRANLLLIAALMVFALWIVGVNLKGSELERHIKVNSGSKSPYSVIFLARIACRYVSLSYRSIICSGHKRC